MSSSQESESGVRLQRLLAMAGIGSRRSCEELIIMGRVTVDGQTITGLGARVDPDTQDVRLDGERLRVHRRSYYLVNKPTGVLCTNRDPEGRPRVIDLFPKATERLFTVGRLDENSEGLLLVTNDGELAHRLAHPRFKVEKIYRVQVAGIPSREIVQQLQEGMYFAEGRFAAKSATLVKSKGHSSLLEIVLTEGQNREIRRLLARVGHKVQRLKRVGMGPLRLGELPPGAYRPLSPPEIQALHALVSGRPARGRDRARRGSTGDRRRPDRGRPRREDGRPTRRLRSERPGRRGAGEQRDRPRPQASPPMRPAARDRRPGGRREDDEVLRRRPIRSDSTPRQGGGEIDDSSVIRRRPAPGFSADRPARPQRGPAGRDRAGVRQGRRPPPGDDTADYVPRELRRNPDDDDTGPRPPRPPRGRRAGGADGLPGRPVRRVVPASEDADGPGEMRDSAGTPRPRQSGGARGGPRRSFGAGASGDRSASGGARSNRGRRPDQRGGARRAARAGREGFTDEFAGNRGEAGFEQEPRADDRGTRGDRPRAAGGRRSGPGVGSRGKLSRRPGQGNRSDSGNPAKRGRSAGGDAPRERGDRSGRRPKPGPGNRPPREPRPPRSSGNDLPEA